MAESVVRYLVLNHEIPVYRIYLVGMGNAPVPADGRDAKAKHVSGGRVEISLLKNDLEQLSSNSGAPMMSGDQAQQPKIVDCSKKCLPLRKPLAQARGFLNCQLSDL